jgi:hypothetical protein
MGLLLLGWVEFLFRQGRVLVQSACECG